MIFKAMVVSLLMAHASDPTLISSPCFSIEEIVEKGWNSSPTGDLNSDRQKQILSEYGILTGETKQTLCTLNKEGQDTKGLRVEGLGYPNENSLTVQKTRCYSASDLDALGLSYSVSATGDLDLSANASKQILKSLGQTIESFQIALCESQPGSTAVIYSVQGSGTEEAKPLAHE